MVLGALRFVIVEVVSDEFEISLLENISIQVFLLKFSLALPSGWKKYSQIRINWRKLDGKYYLLLVIIDLLSWLKSDGFVRLSAAFS